MHSGAWYSGPARTEFSCTRQVIICSTHHQYGLSFLFCSGHIGVLVYVIMTAMNALSIGTYFM